jgi:PAS domain-containing protein
MKAEIDRMDLPDTPLKDDTIISTRDLLQHILNNSVDVIITTDLSGKILFATPNVERLLLWNSLELEGHYIYEFYADCGGLGC